VSDPTERARQFLDSTVGDRMAAGVDAEDVIADLLDAVETAARIIRRLIDGDHIMAGPGDTCWWVDPYDNETRLTDAERAVMAAVNQDGPS
jgi:hypothetical protein